MSKDKEWLKKKVEEMYMDFSLSNNPVSIGKREVIDDFKGLVDQLDEPKITEEQAWEVIGFNYMVDKPAFWGKLEENNWLRGKIVIDKPVIPKFVADWIKKEKLHKFTAYEIFCFDILNDDLKNRVHKWIYDNDDETNREREIIILTALHHGYEVEKEPRWVVSFDWFNPELKKNVRLYFTRFFGVDSDKTEQFEADGYENKHNKLVSKFTEKRKAEAVASLIEGQVEEVGI